MKPARMILIIFLLSLLVGCAGMKKEDTAVQSGESATEPVSRENESTSPESVTAAPEEMLIPSSVTPTGYPRGQVQRQLLFYRGVLWGRDTDDGSMKTQVPDGFTEAAAIAKNDNFKAPAEELCSAQMAEGLKIFAAEAYPRTIYVEEAENRYQRYEPAEGSPSDWTP